MLIVMTLAILRHRRRLLLFDIFRDRYFNAGWKTATAFKSLNELDPI